MEVYVKRVSGHDYRKKGWMISRPYITDESKIDEKILNGTDATIQTLRVDVLHIVSSIAFRELITWIRPYGMWAQTSRVTTIASMEPMNYSLEYNKIQDRVNELKDLPKIEQDKNRLKLYAGTCTEYTVSMDFRTWISFIKWLERDFKIYFAHYGLKILEELNISLEEYYELPFRPILQKRQYFKPEYESKYQSIGDVVNPTIVLNHKDKYNFRCQLVRHHRISITDILLELTEDQHEMLTLDSEIDMEIVARESDLYSLVSSRSCWIADFNIHSKFIELLFKEMVQKSPMQYLPCNPKSFSGRYERNKTCKCKLDMEARLSGKDPGLTCPFFLSENEGKLIIVKRENLFGENYLNNCYKKYFSEY